MDHRRFLIALFICGLTACASAPKRPSGGIPQNDMRYLKERMTWEIESILKKNDIASISIAVVDSESTVWEDGFGFADQENGIPATAHTVYRVGAISKLFTSIATMQLAESGQVDVDAPLADYLPDFTIHPFPKDEHNTSTQKTKEITLRSILTHRSGIPADHLERLFSDEPIDYRDYVRLLKDEFAVSSPDSFYQYSNLAMSLLGHMVEEVSNEDFATHVHKSILEPTGMSSSSFLLTDSIEAQLAKAYAYGSEQKQFRLSPMPAGALYSSAHDLARFIQMCFRGGEGEHGRVLNKETLDEMWRSQAYRNASHFDHQMGLGWHIEDRPGLGRIVGHSGSMMNFKSTILLLPRHKLGVVVLTNSREGAYPIQQISHKALSLLLETKTGVRVPSPDGRARLLNSFSPKEMRSFHGHVQTGMGVFYLEQEDDYLVGHSPGKTIELRPTANKTFSMHYRIFDMFSFQPPSWAKSEYHFVQQGETTILVSRKFRQDRLFGHQFRPALIPKVWKDRLGDYELVNAQKSSMTFQNFSLENFKGSLVLVYERLRGPGRMGLALDPLTETHAIVLGSSRGGGQTLRVEPYEDGEELIFGGLRLRKRQ